MFLFRKLLIAVLSLGLVLSVGGAAFGSELPTAERLASAFQDMIFNTPSGFTGEETALPGGPLDIDADKYNLPGDCRYQNHAAGIASILSVPTGWATRFAVTDPDTLKIIDFIVYDTDGDIDVVVWEDNGGLPGTEVYRMTITPVLYPNWVVVDVSAQNLAFTADFHVGVEPGTGGGTNATYIDMVSDDGSGGGLWSTAWYGGWDYIANWFGTDYTLVMGVYTCMDIYANCYWEGNYTGLVYFVGMPLWGGAGTAVATQIAPSLGGCDIAEINWYVYNPGYPMAYDYTMTVYANDGAGGLPGAVLWSATYSPPHSTGWQAADISGSVFYDAPVWLAFESMAPYEDDIAILSDDAGDFGNANYLNADKYFGFWEYWSDWAGTENNFVMDAYVCCLPLGGVECFPGEDWPTMGKTYNRVNRSLSQLGPIGSATDARCTLTKSWDFYGDGNYLVGQPAISGDYVVGYFYNQLVCLDMNTGALVWEQPRDYTEGVGDGGRCSPTIHDGIVYVGGGDAETFMAYDLLGDGMGGPLQYWKISCDAFTVYAPSVVVDVGGTDVIYWCDNRGNLYAATAGAAGGAPYYGSNPFFYGTGFSEKALATDGTSIYFGVDNFSGTPNLYKVDCATGTEIWSMAPNGVAGEGPGFQLPILDPTQAGIEGCEDAMVYEEDLEGRWLYVLTSFQPHGFQPLRDGGLIYKLNADDASIAWTAWSAGGTNGEPNGLISDLATILYGGWATFYNASRDYAVASYAKASGALGWSNTLTIPDQIHRSSSTPVLSCESYGDQNEPDWIVYPEGAPGYIHFMESEVGGYQFYRRIWAGDAGANANANNNPAVMSDGHLIITNFDFMTCLTNQTDRARLELANLVSTIPVTFGLPYGTQITFDDMIANNGCAPLTILGLTADSEDGGNNPGPAFSSSTRGGSMSLLADNMTEKHLSMVNAVTGSDIMTTLAKDKASAFDKASADTPDWYLGMVSPAPMTVLNPGDPPLPIVIEIDGTTLPRGLNTIFVHIDTDDPDYFLNYARKDNDQDYGIPSVQLGLLGGCLRDFLVLNFGVTGQNFHPVYNTTKVQTDASVDGGTEIDGHAAHVFGNDGLVYSWQDMYHVAFNWEDSWSNYDYNYGSIMPDPYCGQDCDFILTTPTLGMYSADGDPGAGYTAIVGDAISYSYIDSIADFRLTVPDDPPFSSWNWEYNRYFAGEPNPPLSPTLTEGMAFRVLATEYGVTGNPAFNNFTIARHSIYSRYGYAIDDLYVGTIADFDIGNYAQANAGWDGSHSLAWMWDHSNPIDGWGYIKIPFGPGYEPMLNCINADYSAWFFSPNPEFDSIYTWMSERTGSYNPYPVGADKRIFATFAGLDLPAWDWYDGRPKDDVPEEAIVDWAYCFFGLNDLADATDATSYYAMASFVNKLCGYGRGDANDDGVVDLVDIVYLNEFLFNGGNMPFPFAHLGDVDADGDTDVDDALYLANWYWNMGDPPIGKFALPRPYCR